MFGLGVPEIIVIAIIILLIFGFLLLGKALEKPSRKSVGPRRRSVASRSQMPRRKLVKAMSQKVSLPKTI